MDVSTDICECSPCLEIPCKEDALSILLYHLPNSDSINFIVAYFNLPEHLKRTEKNSSIIVTNPVEVSN